MLITIMFIKEGVNVVDLNNKLIYTIINIKYQYIPVYIPVNKSLMH